MTPNSIACILADRQPRCSCSATLPGASYYESACQRFSHRLPVRETAPSLPQRPRAVISHHQLMTGGETMWRTGSSRRPWCACQNWRDCPSLASSSGCWFTKARPSPLPAWPNPGSKCRPAVMRLGPASAEQVFTGEADCAQDQDLRISWAFKRR
jgi:hypothetical protein